MPARGVRSRLRTALPFCHFPVQRNSLAIWGSNCCRSNFASRSAKLTPDAARYVFENANNGDRFPIRLGQAQTLAWAMSWSRGSGRAHGRARRQGDDRARRAPSSVCRPLRSRHQSDRDGLPAALASDCRQAHPRDALTGDRPDVLIPSTQPNIPVMQPTPPGPVRSGARLAPGLFDPAHLRRKSRSVRSERLPSRCSGSRSRRHRRPAALRSPST